MGAIRSSLAAAAVLLLLAGSPLASGQAVKESPSPLDSLQPPAAASDARLKALRDHLVAVLDGPVRAVAHVAFAPDGKTIAASSWDNKLRLWKLQGRAFRLTAEVEGSPSQIAFSPDGKLLAAGRAGKEVVFWDISAKEPKEHVRLAGHHGRPFSLGFSPDGRFFASGNFGPMLRIWRIEKDGPEIVAAFSGDESPSIGLASLSFSPDGAILACSFLTGTKTLRAWDLSDVPMRELPLPDVAARRVLFSPDGRWLLVATTDGTVHLWERKGRQFKERFTLKDHQRTGLAVTLRGAAFAPGGRRLATAGSSGDVRLWDPATGERLRSWQFPSRVNGLAFAPDGRHLAAACEDGTVVVLRVPRER